MDKTKKVAKVVLICFLVFVIVLFCTFLGVLIGCKAACRSMSFDDLHNGMRFLKKSDNDGQSYYCAGRFEESEGIETYFIPDSINNIPVKMLGYSIYLNTYAGCIYANYDLKNLYIPGSINRVYYQYFSREFEIDDSGTEWTYLYKDLKIYYGGEVIDLTKIAGGAQYFVPAENFEQFCIVTFGDDMPDGQKRIAKANISYRTNAAEKNEYYYVDYVNYGEKIANVPPAPTREGYKFGGWYTEAECINEWRFDRVVPQLSHAEDFKELCLYAKWI